jgi:hypothetical protein
MAMVYEAFLKTFKARTRRSGYLSTEWEYPEADVETTYRYRDRPA